MREGAGPGAGQSAGSPLSGVAQVMAGYGGQSGALDGVGMANDSIWQPVPWGVVAAGVTAARVARPGGSVKLAVGAICAWMHRVGECANGTNNRSGVRLGRQHLADLPEPFRRRRAFG